MTEELQHEPARDRQDLERLLVSREGLETSTGWRLFTNGMRSLIPVRVG